MGGRFGEFQRRPVPPPAEAEVEAVAASLEHGVSSVVPKRPRLLKLNFYSAGYFIMVS